MRWFTFAFLFSLAPALVLGQNDIQPDLVPTHLQVTKTTKVKFEGAAIGDVRCDNAGNHYARVVPSVESPLRDSTQQPVRRIRPDGKIAGVFAVPDGFRTQRFFVTGDGEVYQLAWRDHELGNFILAFRSNGSVGAKIRLSADPFVPYQIAFFRTGDFLVSGVGGEHGHSLFTALFDVNGKLLHKIDESEDREFARRAAGGDKDFLTDVIDAGNAAGIFGDSVTGSDGNVYLLRAASPALIYVISPKGEILRKLHINPPGGGLRARGLLAAPGKLAIRFVESNGLAGTMLVVNLNGSLLTSHLSDNRETSPGVPGCYDGSSFTFVTSNEDHEIFVRKAEPK
jgi:hypothetical protein